MRQKFFKNPHMVQDLSFKKSIYSAGFGLCIGKTSPHPRLLLIFNLKEGHSDSVLFRFFAGKYRQHLVIFILVKIIYKHLSFYNLFIYNTYNFIQTTFSELKTLPPCYILVSVLSKAQDLINWWAELVVLLMETLKMP